MAEARLGEMLFADYMRQALATDASRMTIIRAWCVATDPNRRELMLACTGDDDVLGDMVRDPEMQHVLMVLLEPEFTHEAEQMALGLPVLCCEARLQRVVRPDTSSFGSILFREFVQAHASLHTCKMRTYTADNVVKWWAEWSGEVKYMAMEEHCESGEMCSLLFSDYSKREALMQILDKEFAVANYHMQIRYQAAVADGTADAFFGRRAEPSGPVIFAEFVRYHRSLLFSQGLPCTEAAVLVQWRAAADRAVRWSWIHECYHDLSSGELCVSSILNMLEVEFGKT
jgi:hypothetical protein